MSGTREVGTPELSVVVPVFKEGEAVDPVLRALNAGITADHEILVVYDFDEDPTVPVIERLHVEIPAILGLRNGLGRGVLNAMKAGIAASRGDYVLISMADGSDEPHVVDPMVALARDGADVVAASRYMKGGHQVGGPLLKRLMSRTAGLSLHWFGGVATHDPTNNFKLYSRRLLDATPIESPAGFELALELPSRPPSPAAASPRCPPPGATARQARATSSSASGCPSTCTGTGWRCGEGRAANQVSDEVAAPRLGPGRRCASSSVDQGTGGDSSVDLC